MITFLSLSQITEEKISKLFNDNGAFFAFGQKQFEEKIHLLLTEAKERFERKKIDKR